MRKLQAVVTVKGIDTYFIPPQWISVENVYLVPVEIAQQLRAKPQSVLKRYRTEFDILPPDKLNKANHIHRRLRLRTAPDTEIALVADVNIRESN